MTQTLKVKLSKKKFEKALNVKRREENEKTLFSLVYELECLKKGFFKNTKYN